MKTLRNTLFGLLFTLALIALPAAAFAQGDRTYSGDDVYDLAAGALSAPSPQFVMNFSGDDAYDLAAGGFFYEPTVRYVSNFRGDDAYDPIFGWTPHQVQVAQSPSR